MRKAWISGLLECGEASFGLGGLGMMLTGLGLWIFPGFQMLLAFGLEGCFAVSIVGASLLAFPFVVAHLMAVPARHAAVLGMRSRAQKRPVLPLPSVRSTGRR